MSRAYNWETTTDRKKTSFKLVKNKSFIEEERTRLEKALHDEPEKGKGIWSWMVVWLSKSDEEHYKDHDELHCCDICGLIPEKILTSEFSFCEEYSCGMDICQQCAKEMARMKEAK